MRKVPLVTLRPQVAVAGGLDELRRDPHLVPGAQRRALDDRVHVQLNRPAFPGGSIPGEDGAMHAAWARGPGAGGGLAMIVQRRRGKTPVVIPGGVTSRSCPTWARHEVSRALDGVPSGRWTSFSNSLTLQVYDEINVCRGAVHAVSRTRDRSTDVVGNAQPLEEFGDVDKEFGRQRHGAGLARRARRCSSTFAARLGPRTSSKNSASSSASARPG